MSVEVSSLDLKASLTEMSVPLDRILAARQLLSFLWCSVLAAVSLLVVLQLFVAAWQRCLFSSRHSHLVQAPSTPLVVVQSPAVDISADRDANPVTTVTSDRTTVDKEGRGHRHRLPQRHHSTPSTANPVLPPNAGYDDGQYRLRFPTAAATRWRSPESSHSRNVDYMSYYTDFVVESNV